ncbi:unnamed protein product [Adineta steineri]|uniref:Tetraspanin n=1 Tax=Adineta steineri TaxID=433720 RepID=A0A818T1D0_9BILA|nr:unnamed protein product [Adineta steineri]
MWHWLRESHVASIEHTVCHFWTCSRGTWHLHEGYFPFILIGGGVLVVLIALLGCMGSLWCNRCMLYMYATAAIILMILQLIGFGMAVGYKKKLETVYHDGLKKVFTKALAQNETKVLEAFHKLEDTVKCCGVDGVTDYPTGLTPTSCWQHTDGCATVIIDVLEKNLPIIGGSLGGVLVLELLCLIFTLILAKNLAHAKEETFSSNPGEVIRELVPGRRANYRKF